MRARVRQLVQRIAGVPEWVAWFAVAVTMSWPMNPQRRRRWRCPFCQLRSPVPVACDEWWRLHEHQCALRNVFGERP